MLHGLLLIVVCAGYSPNCRELVFSETASQDRASLCGRTGTIARFAPVEYPRSRRLATPMYKNSLVVAENASSRKVSE